MGNLKLSMVLKGSDIVAEPNQRICIVSGVGSGKNYFVENELNSYGNVLYISSRRATVDEIVKRKIATLKINWDKEIGDVVTLTNAGIEQLCKDKKFNADRQAIISHFNFIVVDEAHSIVTDSTYASSSYHVYAFIEYIVANFPKIKIILMTGTPDPLERYLNKHKYTIIDKRIDCEQVLPRVISIVDKDTAFRIIETMPTNQKTIYYSNSATGMVAGKKSLVNRLRNIGFSDDEIGICMSGEKAKELKQHYTKLDEKCIETKTAIVETNKLAEKNRILLTTASLKEGVNIESEDIKIAFCESHVLSEIQQFAGRVRNGLDVLYIITPVRQHDISDDTLHELYMKFNFALKNGQQAANTYLEKTVNDEQSSLYAFPDFYDRGYMDLHFLYTSTYSLATLSGSVVPLFIKVIESSNEYLYFNYLTNQFECFSYKYLEHARINYVLSGYQWSNDIAAFCKKEGIEYLEKAVQAYVTDSDIAEYCESCSNVIWVDDEKEQILQELRIKLLLPPNAMYDKINNALDIFRANHVVKQASTTRKGVRKRGIRILKQE